MISFLNCFISPFREDPVEEVKEVPVTNPGSEKCDCIDLHVVCSKGTHYIIDMQAQRQD